MQESMHCSPELLRFVHATRAKLFSENKKHRPKGAAF
ncbi:hypothetical protein RB2150_07173 [Rhodobacterales bacterium HTCC2150]|nr:hypothetical protein RB2150_07173 [Rhodobacterales bacterium HTCC2150] [Rhodobacteraceae bacterium HTCC2150]